MAIANLTTVDAYLKELYAGQMVESMVYKNNPLLAMLPKMESFTGRNMPMPIISSNPQNRSRTFTNANSATTSSDVDSFLLTRVKDYSLAFIDGETLKASEGDKGAFQSTLDTEMKGAFQAATNNCAFSLTRDQSGYRAQVNAEPGVASTTVITLKSRGDIVGFEKNQSIVIWSAKTGGTQKIYDTGVTAGLISAIDRSAGTITINTPYTASGTIAADDFLFVDGDRGNSVAGLESWIPDLAPTGGDSFFGVDRSTDTDRLAGVRYDGSSDPIEEAIVEGGNRVAENGGAPDFAFINFRQWSRLIKSLGSKVQYVNILMEDIGVGFEGVKIHSGNGTMTVVPDRNIRGDKAYLLQMDTWKLASIGPMIRLLDFDGNRFLRATNDDNYEVRVGGYGNLGCHSPGFNGVVSLANV